MDRGSIDNVAGLAAELDLALDSSLDLPTFSLPSFDIEPPATPTVEQEPEKDEEDHVDQDEDHLLIEDNPPIEANPPIEYNPPIESNPTTAENKPEDQQADNQHLQPSRAADGRSNHSRSTSAGSDVTVSQGPSTHPISCMQGPFQESIVDSMDRSSHKKITEKLNAEARRRQLLELEEAGEGYSSRWQHKPDSKYHPLWKVVAQISFGVHLLHKRKAKSDEQVVKTLQDHVDEIDSFVEDTLADLELATKDIDERLLALMLPLEHSRTFNRMLCDRTFRQSIVDGNDIIERIIDRTTVALQRSLQDVNEGDDAIKELAKFLERLEPEWAKHNEDLLAIFNAMRSNTQGWLRCFGDLQVKAEHLSKLMSRLACVVDEVAKRCGIASRRKTPTGTVGRKSYQSVQTVQSVQSHDSTKTLQPTRRTPNQVNKPLPPPPLRQKNQTGNLRTSSSPLQQSTEKTQRPHLVSVSSSQTIDCTRPPPQSLDKRNVHPATDQLGRSDNGFSPAQPDTSWTSAKAARTVSHQTGAERLARRNAIEQLITPDPAGSKSVVNGTRSRSRDAPGPTPSKSTPTFTQIHHEPVRIGSVQAAPRPPQLAGLGISAPPVRTDSVASSTKDFTCMDYLLPSDSSRSNASRRPSDTTAEHDGYTTDPQLKLGAFSVFPSTLDPRAYLARNDEKISAKTTPRISTDSRASDKMVVTERLATNDESTPSSANDSAYQSSLDTPSLSSSTSQSNLAPETTSQSVPFTPDDITPYGALRSHPITRSMYFPTSMYFPASTPQLTALPPIPPGTEEDDFLHSPGHKKPPLMKKPSMTSMKTLFGRKPAKKEAYLGSGGLGGFVEVT